MREYIDKEKVLSELRISAEHHVQNNRQEALVQYRDRYIVSAQPTVTVREILKPYFEKLKRQISEKYNGGSQTDRYVEGRDSMVTEVIYMIDKIYRDDVVNNE